MDIYYIDEPLTNDEFEFIKSTLSKRNSGISFDDAKQVRIPAIFPAPNVDGAYDEGILERIRIAKRAVLRTNIEENAGNRTVLVMPKYGHWGSVMQLAMQEITGYFPFVVLIWSTENDKLVRSPARFIDDNGMATYGT